MLGQTRTDIAFIRTNHFRIIEDRLAAQLMKIFEKGNIVICADNSSDEFGPNCTMIRKTDTLHHEGI